MKCFSTHCTLPNYSICGGPYLACRVYLRYLCFTQPAEKLCLVYTQSAAFESSLAEDVLKRHALETPHNESKDS